MESIVIYLNDFIYIELDRAIKQSTSRKIFTYYDINTTAIYNTIWLQNVDHIKLQLVINN
jgi:hypothetical protein